MELWGLLVTLLVVGITAITGIRMYPRYNWILKKLIGKEEPGKPKMISLDNAEKICTTNGKQIYKGTFAGMPCAVKVVWYQYNEDQRTVLENELTRNEENSKKSEQKSGKERNCKREVKIHQKATMAPCAHKNIVRYFCHETIIDDHQIARTFIALELCDGDLEKTDLKSELCGDICFQIADGLSYLHNHLSVAHRDLKPANVLIKMDENRKKCILKLADFGMSKVLQDGSVCTLSQFCGSFGWQAPEILEVEQKIQTKLVSRSDMLSKVDFKRSDIFSLGLVFKFVVEKCTKQPDETTASCITALIKHATNEEPQKRPPVDEVLKHPAFYDDARTLDFLSNVSNVLQSTNVPGLETPTSPIFSGEWKSYLTDEVKQHLFDKISMNYPPDYEPDKIKSLLRAIRNMKSHYDEKQKKGRKEVKSLFDSYPSGFVHYFTSRFPGLLLHTYECMKDCKDNSLLHEFYHHNL